MVQKTSPSPYKHGYSKCTHFEQKVRCSKMSHSAYREYIAKYLITTSIESATCLKKKPSIDVYNSHLRLAGKHFVKKLPTVRGSKRKLPARKCSVCNFTRQQLAKMGHLDINMPIRYSSYGCTICSQVTLCLVPCFEIFHSKLNYRQLSLQTRISEIL